MNRYKAQTLLPSQLKQRLVTTDVLNILQQTAVRMKQNQTAILQPHINIIVIVIVIVVIIYSYLSHSLAINDSSPLMS